MFCLAVNHNQSHRKLSRNCLELATEKEIQFEPMTNKRVSKEEAIREIENTLSVVSNANDMARTTTSHTNRIFEQKIYDGNEAEEKKEKNK